MADCSHELVLSAKHRDLLLKFRERLQDILQPEHNDYWLLRFLRARNFNLKKSESMFRKNVQWRAENKVTSIEQDFEEPEVLKKYGVGGYLGPAKDGRPAFLDPTGNVDFKGLLHSVPTSDMVKLYIKTLERLQNAVIQQTEKLNRQIDGIYYIVDLENLGQHHLWKPGVHLFTSDRLLNINQFNPDSIPYITGILSHVTQLCEQHYPELLHRIIVVRAPRLFPLAYSIVRPFLSEETRNKITVLKNNFADELLKVIDADMLPKYWGGNMIEDGDPMCPGMIKLGGKVPKEYYSTGRHLSIDASQMTTKEIARGGTLQLTYRTTQCNSVLRYEFRTEHHDLAFGVKRVGEDGSKAAIVKTQRYSCHLVPETGELILEEPGTYVVKMDNSYSWARSKKLSYWIELMEPDIEGVNQGDNDEEEDNEEEEFVAASEG